MLHNISKFNVRVFIFQIFPGSMPPDPLALACHARWLCFAQYFTIKSPNFIVWSCQIYNPLKKVWLWAWLCTHIVNGWFIEYWIAYQYFHASIVLTQCITRVVYWCSWYVQYLHSSHEELLEYFIDALQHVTTYLWIGRNAWEVESETH